MAPYTPNSPQYGYAPSDMGTPSTPYMGTVGLPTPPNSAGKTTAYYPSRTPGTPGAPYMNVVPLPGHACAPPPLFPRAPQANNNAAYMTPPTSPARGAPPPTLHPYLASDQAAFNMMSVPHGNFAGMPASNPPVAAMALTIPGIPHTFTAHNPNGVTVYDVFNALYTGLAQSIPAEQLKYLGRDQIARSSMSHQQRNTRVRDNYVRYYDLLAGARQFGGLAPASDSTWTVRTF
ncbi:hypothetical protein FA95DRAFT_1564862 [Auriscalpium vulgare]|uniref:Uncharacterized protein n=1 Tax=Auriscalpium vulgare TaxID=40419 RepID=A0ACB8RCX0_9AGAM|nr:hypothetical protein FA95DRAFT_1564862 [Auriscalpium vulgare]